MTAVISEVRLADCVDLLAGFAFKSDRFEDSSGGGVPLVKGENVGQGLIHWDISRYWPAAESVGLEKFGLQAGDIVLAMDRPWVPAGLKWAVIRENDPAALLVQRCARLRTRVSHLRQDFLRYVIGGPGFEAYIRPITTGVNVPHISGAQILAYSFRLPPLEEQKRIAGILSAYDDLIENCERRIRVLDEMARSLYREWFVDFRFPGASSGDQRGGLPKGWSVRPLAETCVNFDRMRRPLSKTVRAERPGPYPYYGAAKVFDFIDGYLFDGQYLLLAEDGSVATAEGHPVLQITRGKFWPNNHTHVLQGRDAFSTFFLYLSLSGQSVAQYVTGAAQPKITQENMNRMPVVCGPAEVHQAFDRITGPMLDQMQSLGCRVQNLRATRDLLLPRLLSGQLSVDDAA